MDRRKFIQVVGLGGTAFMFSGNLASCRGDGAAAAFEAWEPDKSALPLTDPRLKILSYAILAPNPHNKQPWKIHLRGDDQMMLYVDPERLLPMTDPLHRQIYIGQGTFLEHVNLAARALGFNCQIDLFPDGTDDVSQTGRSPVARITLSPAPADIDDLFKEIPRRATNRLPYQTAPVEPVHLDVLAKLSKSIDIRFITEADSCGHIAQLVTSAMKVETFLDRTHEETVGMLRFSDMEILQHRDGFGYANLGITGISRFFAEKFAGRADAFSESFKKKTVDSVRRMATSTGTFGLMVTAHNDRASQIEAGRCFAKIHLTATRLGLALHPMSQILQEYEEMTELREELSRVVEAKDQIIQMLFRIGRAEPASHSPRRLLNDFLTT